MFGAGLKKPRALRLRCVLCVPGSRSRARTPELWLACVPRPHSRPPGARFLELRFRPADTSIQRAILAIEQIHRLFEQTAGQRKFFERPTDDARMDGSSQRIEQARRQIAQGLPNERSRSCRDTDEGQVRSWHGVADRLPNDAGGRHESHRAGKGPAALSKRERRVDQKFSMATRS
jgi:hypothetical protein